MTILTQLKEEEAFNRYLEANKRFYFIYLFKKT